MGEVIPLLPFQRLYHYTHEEPNTGCWLWSGPSDFEPYILTRVPIMASAPTHTRLVLFQSNYPMCRFRVLHPCKLLGALCVNPEHQRAEGLYTWKPALP